MVGLRGRDDRRGSRNGSGGGRIAEGLGLRLTGGALGGLLLGAFLGRAALLRLHLGLAGGLTCGLGGGRRLLCFSTLAVEPLLLSLLCPGCLFCCGRIGSGVCGRIDGRCLGCLRLRGLLDGAGRLFRAGLGLLSDAVSLLSGDTGVLGCGGLLLGDDPGFLGRGLVDDRLVLGGLAGGVGGTVLLRLLLRGVAGGDLVGASSWAWAASRSAARRSRSTVSSPMRASLSSMAVRASASRVSARASRSSARLRSSRSSDSRLACSVRS